MKNSKKVTAVLLAGTMSFTLVIPAFAADVPSEKEEVVYINLDAEGEIKDLNVVNIFGKGEIVDYGAYDSVEMMNTSDEITQKGDKISFSTDTDRVYYKGKMSNKKIPWNISIRYYLDGKEYSAEEVAGKSGKLEMHLKITENEECEGEFYENYALQASFTLDTEKCTNIVAENATLANVGKEKQVSYTMLPGKGIDTTVTADVKDFEMSAVSINGIPLSLNVEVDDEELVEQVTELLDAIEQINDGTGELQNGVTKLQDGAQGELKNGVNALQNGAVQLQNGAGELKSGGSSLSSGAGELKTGAASLNAGVLSLNSGITEIQKGLNQLNEKSPELKEGSSQIYQALCQIQDALDGVSSSADQLDELVSASSQIQRGMDELVNGASEIEQNTSFEAYKAAMAENGLDIEKLREGNTAAYQQLDEVIRSLNEMIGTAEKLPGIDVTELKAKVAQLEQIRDLFYGNNASIEGTEKYLTALNSNMDSLMAGAVQLRDSYAEFNTAIEQLADTLSGMMYQMSELAEAVDTLVEEYQKLDNGINEYTNGVAEIVAGYFLLSQGSSSLAAGSSQLVNGSSNLYDGTTELLSGIVEFYNATGTLKDGTGQLDEGVAELLTGIAELNEGAGTLKDGTGELREKTSGMDTQITDKIDEMLDSITGGDSETVSFVSEKNTNVDSVQFVIKTDEIEVEDTGEVEEAEKTPMTIWEKILHLFGMD
ncbi:MAG: hypothetical protein SOU03_04725 [Dorea sp.]|nr:hypothetical protein [Dorea sp.]